MCTEGPDIVIIVLGVVGGVVGVGLILLLLVKLLTSLFDRLEYQHFVKELQSPKWAKVSLGQGRMKGTRTLIRSHSPKSFVDHEVYLYHLYLLVLCLHR